MLVVAALGGNALLRQGEPLTGSLHVAFTAPNRAVVDAFYEAAMAAGGRDNGAPGLRPHYHENYYGAFVLDPAKPESRALQQVGAELVRAPELLEGALAPAVGGV